MGLYSRKIIIYLNFGTIYYCNWYYTQLTAAKYVKIN